MKNEYQAITSTPLNLKSNAPTSLLLINPLWEHIWSRIHVSTHDRFITCIYSMSYPSFFGWNVSSFVRTPINYLHVFIYCYILKKCLETDGFQFTLLNHIKNWICLFERKINTIEGPLMIHHRDSRSIWSPFTTNWNMMKIKH